ncbi:site-specific integrase [Anabaena sp. 4-3]|uniref:site-specific integrase n=1 Tax=Anabaena sp. 4-3 TaxID=1811979 RepID=UPI00083311F5|nr:site-specific integrase [Anabaena sp. 4-3]
MPKTRLHRDYNASTVDKEFKATTDGTYMGTMKHVLKQTAKSEEQLKLKLEEANTRLKADKARVSIIRTGNALQLQATLPLKPGDIDKTGKGKKQYKISLGIPANLHGLKTATEEAHELSKLIARQTFEWTDKYLGKKQDKENKTFGELLEQYEGLYFSERQRNIGSEGTFANYMKVLKQFDREMLATPENLKKQFDAIPNDIGQWKHRTAITLNLFTKTFDIPLKVKFQRPQTERRDIPSDTDIETSFLKWEEYAKNRRNKRKEQADNWLVFRWIYGMIAAYGCRPHEVILNPDFKYWLSQDNTDFRWKVYGECKTGFREVIPLHENWVELFELRNPEIINLVEKYINGRCDLQGRNTLVQAISDWFQKVKVGFRPYDLRHAWAIRAHLMGVPLKAAADNLGHTIEQHTDTYQKWFSIEHRKQAIKQAVNKKDEMDELKEENIMLKTEVARLKSELEKLMLMLTEHQIKQALSN